ncbi:MAG TPA: two-component regulator propeller domain-containing protein, partial [Sediminibacterium sp.]|nr:two-component regulator propeller domain-containing protein [Sediminibacterium sp.]
MRKYWSIILLTLGLMTGLHAQPPFSFNHISIDDGLGLASNVVYCTYQDPRGFIWVGTANGLQRFDGNRFLQIFSGKENRTVMISALTQIIPADARTIWLSFPNRHEFGLFHTDTYTYTPIPVRTAKPLNKSNRLRMWKDARGE